MARKKFNLGGSKPKEKDWKAQLTTPTKEVPILQIITDPKLQHRARMNQDAITDYAQIMKDGGQLAPVKLMETPDGKKYLYDGYHTLEAALASGQQTLKATIKRGTWREAWLESLGVNHDHGVRRSVGDKRKAVDDAISDPEVRDSIIASDGKWSFRQVAKYTKTTHPFVSKRWEKMYPPDPTPDPTPDRSLAPDQAATPTQERLTGEGGNVSADAQLDPTNAALDQGGNVSTDAKSNEPNVDRGHLAKNETTPSDLATPARRVINEITSMAKSQGADVIDLNEAQFAKIIYHLPDGKEHDLTINDPQETIIILRFPAGFSI